MAWGQGTAGNDKPEWRARREKLLQRYSRMSDAALRAEYKRMQAGSPASVALSNKHADLAGYLATEQTDREWWGRPERVRAGRAQSGGHMAEQSGDNFDTLTNEKLRIELRSRGLPVSGNKAALIARLRGNTGTRASGEPKAKAAAAPKEKQPTKAGMKRTGVGNYTRRTFRRESKHSQVTKAPSTKLKGGAYSPEMNAYVKAEKGRRKAAAEPKARKAPKTRPMKRLSVAEAKAAAAAEPKPRNPRVTRPMQMAAARDAVHARRGDQLPPGAQPRGTPVKTRPVGVGTERRKVEGRMVTRVRQAPATRPIQRGTRPLEASERIRAREGQRAEAERTRKAEKTGERRAPKTKPLSNRFVYTGAKGNPRYRPESPSTRPVYRASDLGKGQGGHLYVRQAPVTKPGANRVEAQTRAARAVARAEPSTRSRASIASVPPRPLSAAERRKYDALVTQVNRGEVSQTRLIPYQIHAGGERQFRANVRKMNRHGVRQLAEELQEEHGMPGDLDEMSDDTLRARIIGHVKTCRTCRGQRG